MTQSALRFAHAGNLRLDAPLRGIGPLPRAVRPVVEDAPIIAWRRLVDACIEREAEFLLLTPRTVGASLSLRERCELLSGVKRLAEAGLSIYWVLDPDEESAWRKSLSEY